MSPSNGKANNVGSSLASSERYHERSRPKRAATGPLIPQQKMEAAFSLLELGGLTEVCRKGRIGTAVLGNGGFPGVEVQKIL